MEECPYCEIGFQGDIEMELVEIKDGDRRYVCPECGFERWVS